MTPSLHFLKGELIHLVDKTKNVWLIVGQLPIKDGFIKGFINLGSPVIYFFYLRTTIRQKYTVLFHLFFLLCTIIRPKITSLIDLFLLFAHDHSREIYDPLSFILFRCITIRPKIRVVINLFILFVHDHSIKN